MMTEHKYSKTAAAMMLAEGLRSAAQERNLSLREIGRRLGYRQPVVLSHMASGRVPVPIGRAVAIAEQVGLRRDQFLEAVLHQHHPAVEWGLISAAAHPILDDLERTAGRPLSGLSAEHKRILQEVLAARHPQERWVSDAEAPVVDWLRKMFPTMAASGLSDEDWDVLHLIADLRTAKRHSDLSNESRNR